MRQLAKILMLVTVMAGLVINPAYNSVEAATKSSKHKTSLKTKKYRSGVKKINYKPSHKKSYARKSYSMSNALPVINAADYDGTGALILASSKALVVNQNTNEVIYAKNTNTQTPIASLTKLMTAMVILDSGVDLNETVTISEEDKDYLKGTSSRIAVGSRLTRQELMHLALIASENRAASALATSYPGGKAKFVSDMNIKAMSLGMQDSFFADSTGLDSHNVSTAEDLVKMVNAAYSYPLIRDISTTASYDVFLPNRRGISHFNNTNLLLRNNNNDWQIGLSKTGYISEAGRCLVMQATMAGEPLIIVLLDSDGKYSRIGDANRVRKWVEHNLVVRPPMEADDDTPVTVSQQSAQAEGV